MLGVRSGPTVLTLCKFAATSSIMITSTLYGADAGLSAVRAVFATAQQNSDKTKPNCALMNSLLSGQLEPLDRNVHKPPVNIAVHSLAPTTQVVGYESFVVGRGLFDCHVMGGQNAGGHARHIAPGLSVVGAEGDIVAVPGMLGMCPAGLLWNTDSKGGDKNTAA